MAVLVGIKPSVRLLDGAGWMSQELYFNEWGWASLETVAFLWLQLNSAPECKGATALDLYLFCVALFFPILKHWQRFPKCTFKRKVSTKSSSGASQAENRTLGLTEQGPVVSHPQRAVVARRSMFISTMQWPPSVPRALHVQGSIPTSLLTLMLRVKLCHGLWRYQLLVKWPTCWRMVTIGLFSACTPLAALWSK